MNINLIAAIGKNNELGKNGDLIWKIKEDMKFFKETTINHPVVMGRLTFESLPKVLSNRKNIVISSSQINNSEIEIYKSIKEFLECYNNCEEDIFIIGGASIYREFIKIANKMYLTLIDAIADADVYFPKFSLNDWEENILFYGEENSIKYKHVLYKRKNL